LAVPGAAVPAVGEDGAEHELKNRD
jgi:hypothetical protein